MKCLFRSCTSLSAPRAPKVGRHVSTNISLLLPPSLPPTHPPIPSPQHLIRTASSSSTFSTHPPTYPPTQSGTTLAALQTFNSLAWIMSNNISLLSLRIWDVDAQTVERGEWSGIWRLTLLTTASQLLGKSVHPL